MALKYSSAICFLQKWVSKSERQDITGRSRDLYICDGDAVEALEITFLWVFHLKQSESLNIMWKPICKYWLMLCAFLCPNGQKANRTVIDNFCVFSWLTSLLFTGAIMHRLFKFFSDWSRFEMLPREMYCKQHQSKGRWGGLSGKSKEN